MSWFEIFYDLIIATTISRLGDVLFADPSWAGSLLVVGAMLIVFSVWLLSALFFGVAVGDPLWRKGLLLVQLLLLVIAALATGEDGLENWVGAVALAGAFSIAAVIYRTARGEGESATARLRRLGNRILLLTAVMLVAGSAVGIWANSEQGLHWADVILLLAVLGLLAPTLGSFLKGVLQDRQLDLNFLETRFESLVLIAVGEMTTRLVLAPASKGNIPSLGFFVLTFAMSFSVWAIYSLGVTPSGVPQRPSRLRLWIVGHALYLLSAVFLITSFTSFTITDFAGEYLNIQVEWSPLPIFLLFVSLLIIMESQRPGGLDDLDLPILRVGGQAALMARLRDERRNVLRLQAGLAAVALLLWVLFYLRPTTGVPWYSVAGAGILLLNPLAIALLGRKKADLELTR